MYVPDFSGCRAKIGRAKHHRNELESLIKTTSDDKGCHPSLGVKFKPETGDHVVYVSEVPDRLAAAFQTCALQLGDSFHNLRSSLDHLAFQLGLKNTDGKLKVAGRVQFPLEDKMSTFDRRCVEQSPRDPGAWLAELHGDDQAIIKRFQPDGGTDGGRLLRRLRNFSNTDKHKLLTPVAVMTTQIYGAIDLSVLVIATAHVERLKRNHELGVIPRAELGAELFWARLPDSQQVNVDVAAHVTPHISLNQPEGFIDPVAAIDKILTEVEAVMTACGA